MMPALISPSQRLDRATILRGVACGAVWGITVAGALLVLSFNQSEGICLAQIVETTSLAVAAGIVTIGPLALLRRRAQIAAQ